MCCEVDNDFTATIEAGLDLVDRVGSIEDDETGAVRLLMAGQVVATLDAGEAVSQLRSCLGRGYRFTGSVVGSDTVWVTNA